MKERDAIAWLHRRVGFGLAPGELDRLEAIGVAGVLDQLLDPDAHGVPAAPDPWAGLDYSTFDPDNPGSRDAARESIGAWLVAMVTTPRPLEEWMRWYWHGLLTSSLRVLRHPNLMITQLRLYGQRSLGDVRTLLREVTTDPGMLVYLDGRTNERGQVNENYGRELLELFALGVGNYTEADVRAGAEALTGWRVVRGSVPTGPVSTFDRRRHDDTPKRYLGVDGVHDVDTVVDAVVAHEACAPYLARRLARAVLGPGVDAGLVDRLARDFRDGGLQIRPLLRALLEAGLDGASTELLSGPVSWLTRMLRATAAPLPETMRAAGEQLAPAGQIPMLPPNVAGWPGGSNWLTSSATVARMAMASVVAEAAPADGPAARAAAGTSGSASSSGARPAVAALADALGYPEGFGPATIDALVALSGSAGRAAPVSVLSVALAAPETVLL